MYGKYSNDFNKIGFIPPKSLSNGGTAYYNYEIIEASNTSFKARATGAQDFDSDGMVSIWEIDQEKISLKYNESNYEPITVLSLNIGIYMATKMVPTTKPKKSTINGSSAVLSIFDLYSKSFVY